MCISFHDHPKVQCQESGLRRCGQESTGPLLVPKLDLMELSSATGNWSVLDVGVT
jgi:hypothetical protein